MNDRMNFLNFLSDIVITPICHAERLNVNTERLARLRGLNVNEVEASDTLTVHLA